MIDYEIRQLQAALPRAFRRRRDPSWLPPGLDDGDVPDFDLIRIEGRLTDRELDVVDPLLSDAAGAGGQTFDDAAGHVQSRGWEAIAWYSPFHLRPHDDEWGVYIREDAIWSAVFDLYDLSGRSIKRSTLFSVLFDSTLAHERFHFRTEVFASISEGILRRPRYMTYTDVVYKPSWPGEACIEESLATAMGIRSIDDRAAREVLRRYFSSAPPAYRNFERFHSRKSYVEGIKVLAGQAIQASAAPNNTNRYLVGNFSAASFRELPIYLLRTTNLDFVPAEDIYRLSPPKMRTVERACWQLGGEIRTNGRHGKYCLFPRGKRVPISADFDHRKLISQFRDASGRERRAVMAAMGLNARARRSH